MAFKFLHVLEELINKIYISLLKALLIALIIMTINSIDN